MNKLLLFIFFPLLLFSQLSPNSFNNYFFNNKNIMLFIDPSNGKILEANNVAKKFYGYDNLTSMSIQEINTFTKEQVISEMKKAKNELRNYFIFIHRFADGTTKKVKVFSHPIQYKNKKVLFSTIYPLILEKEFIDKFNLRLEKQVKLQSAELKIEYEKRMELLLSVLGISLFTILVLLFLYRYKVLSQKTIQKQNKIIEQKQYELKQYIELIDKYIITSSTDLNGKILDVSDAFCKINGYFKEELIGKTHSIIKHPNMDPEVNKKIWKTITQDKTWHGEIMNKNKFGETYWVEGTISPKYDENGKKIGYISIRHDITAKKTIEELSITDGLTNIFNRRHFDKIFPIVINTAKRNNDLISFLFLDIDYFKHYNDTYGHQMGDEVLIKVANCIKNLLRRSDDNCFRLGGEEFGVIFKAESKDKAEIFANKIRKSIENLCIEHSHSSVSSFVTISIGLICKNAKEIKDNNQIYKDADDLLYKAKESGRNKVVCS